jgi:hypothetical protein
VHAEALAVLVAITADFVLNRWNFEILFLGSKVRPVRGADNLTTNYEPII